MIIQGLEPFTTLDYPGHLACTIFLFGCNFRCGFCHNPELVCHKPQANYTQEEVLAFLEKRKPYLEGVCITGGEPLLTLDQKFLIAIKTLGYKIKLDTNGSFPEKLEQLLKAGLIDAVAMDIKAAPSQYATLANAPVHQEKLEKSIRLIMQYLDDYEFRTTIVPELHSKTQVQELFSWLSSFGVVPLYSLQGFKSREKLVDPSFTKYSDASTTYLEELKAALPTTTTIEIKN